MANLTEFYTFLKGNRLHHILLIPFEDSLLRKTIETALPGCTFDEWTKEDLAGLSPFQLLRKLRSKRWEAVVLSLHRSTVNRSRNSSVLFLSLVKARLRWLRESEELYSPIYLSEIVFIVFPKLIMACFCGLIAIGIQYLSILTTRIKMLFTKKQLREIKQGGTILFLRTDLPGILIAGGSISHVKGILQAFLDNGFRVVYISDARNYALQPEVIQCPLQPLAFLDILDEFQLIAYNFQLLRHLKRIYHEFSPTLIYQRHSVFQIAVGIFAYFKGIPFILEANASEVWVKKHWSRLIFEDLAQRCEKLILQLADRVAVISKGVAEQLAPFGLKSEKTILNPNGVDPKKFHPAIDGTVIRRKYGFTNHCVVGFIGTFTRWHGIETLFEAAMEIVAHHKDIRFLLIGDGNLKSILEQRAMKTKIAEKIAFTGLIPHTNAPQYLAACDIVISPHLGFEGKEKFFGSPTKLFEYMAMGKPIIASKLEQIGEIINDGVNGLHMEPGNAKQLVEKILLLANNERLRRQLGEQAHLDIMDKYTWNHNIHRILNSLMKKTSNEYICENFNH